MRLTFKKLITVLQGPSPIISGMAFSPKSFITAWWIVSKLPVLQFTNDLEASRNWLNDYKGSVKGEIQLIQRKCYVDMPAVLELARRMTTVRGVAWRSELSTMAIVDVWENRASLSDVIAKGTSEQAIVASQALHDIANGVNSVYDQFTALSVGKSDAILTDILGHLRSNTDIINLPADERMETLAVVLAYARVSTDILRFKWSFYITQATQPWMIINPFKDVVDDDKLIAGVMSLYNNAING